MQSSSDSGSGKEKACCSQKQKQKHNLCRGKKALYIVGTGPGNEKYICQRALDIIKSADAIAGYTTYIDLIKPIIKDKEIIKTPMRKEVERVEAAIDIALKGKSCAIVSSGDPGIYAMAGLALEIIKKRKIPLASSQCRENGLYVEIVPGIPALAAGASLLGAPLTHDFAAISLSDLLTPWNLIEKRLEAAAKADFVIVIYNPKSKKRKDHLKTARKIIMKHRSGKTPVGIVTGAMRDNQKIHITDLENLDKADVDMQTTVFIGNSNTVTYLDFMITPRGYSEKYSL